MLPLHIDSFELFDNNTNEFLTIPEMDIVLEHSLESISKWESIWKKPYLSDKTKTLEEDISYIQCMASVPIDPIVIKYMSSDNKKKINDYINDSSTATWFNDQNKKSGRKEVITSEVIYYWMIEMGIPFECDKWNINRLLTLVRVCGSKMSKEKKMSKNDIFKQNRALNAQRRARYNSKG